MFAEGSECTCAGEARGDGARHIPSALGPRPCCVQKEADGNRGRGRRSQGRQARRQARGDQRQLDQISLALKEFAAKPGEINGIADQMYRAQKGFAVKPEETNGS